MTRGGGSRSKTTVIVPRDITGSTRHSGSDFIVPGTALLTIETRPVPGRLLGRLMPILLLLSACSTQMDTSRAPAPAVTLTSDEAVAMAVEVASHPQPELSPGATSPVVLTVELIRLEDALRQAGGSDSVPAGMSADAPVWFVALQGEWKAAFPRPANGEEESYNHLWIIVDANSGEVTFSSARR